VEIGIENVMLENFWNCHFLFSYVFFLIVRNLKARRPKNVDVFFDLTKL
jgi:hypothetical protein